MSDSVEHITEALSEHFNSERSFIALVGGMMVTVGAHMFKMDKPLLGSSDEDSLEQNQQIASLLFSLGWLVVALSIVYDHSLSVKGVIAEPLSLKTLLAFASAVAVVAGASMARAERDADPTSSDVSSLAQGLFLGGWVGITLSMVTESFSPMKMFSSAKIALILLGVATTLGGVMTSRAFELEDAIQYASGDYSNAVDASRHWPKWLFGAGWVILAAGIGYWK